MRAAALPGAHGTATASTRWTLVEGAELKPHSLVITMLPRYNASPCARHGSVDQFSLLSIIGTRRGSSRTAARHATGSLADSWTSLLRSRAARARANIEATRQAAGADDRLIRQLHGGAPSLAPRVLRYSHASGAVQPPSGAQIVSHRPFCSRPASAPTSSHRPAAPASPLMDPLRALGPTPLLAAGVRNAPPTRRPHALCCWARSPR